LANQSKLTLNKYIVGLPFYSPYVGGATSIAFVVDQLSARMIGI